MYTEMSNRYMYNFRILNFKINHDISQGFVKDTCSQNNDVILNNENTYLLTVFNATFNNISVISRRSVLLVEETGRPEKSHKSLTNIIT